MIDLGHECRRRLIASVERPGLTPGLGWWAFLAVMLVASGVVAAAGLADDIRETRAAIERCAR